MAKCTCSFAGCGKEFNRPSRLLQHQRIHTKERPFCCEVENCAKSYTRAAHLKRHLETAHCSSALSNEPECCSVCEETFASVDTLKRHKVRAHANASNYKCPVEGCGKGFSKRFQLRHHEYEHNGVEPFQCHKENCGKKFTQRSHLLRHLKVHEGYKCEFGNCGQVFEKWTLLRKHKASAHKPDSRCNKCENVFVSKSDLKWHNATEHKVLEGDAFMCCWQGCTRLYSNKRNLAAHVRSFHENISFACSEEGCGRTFSSLQKQKLHRKSHQATKLKVNMRRKKSLAARLSRITMKSLQSATDSNITPEPIVEIIMESSNICLNGGDNSTTRMDPPFTVTCNTDPEVRAL